MNPATTDSLQAIKLQALSKAGSLSTIKINQLTYKLDSLQKVVQKTEIGQGYFSDIIGSQLTYFSLIIGAIIGLIALISWGGIIYFYKKEIKEIDVKYSTFQETVTVQIKNIETDNRLNEMSVYNAMAVLNYTNATYWHFFIWQLRCFNVQVRMNESYNWDNNKEYMEDVIERIKQVLPSINYLNIEKVFFDEAQNIFVEIRKSKVEAFQQFKKELLEIEEEFYKGYYAYLASKHPPTSS